MTQYPSLRQKCPHTITMPWIFLLLPWIELWTLIELGAATSALTALAWVFLSLMLGLGLIRRQGMQLLAEMQQQSGGRILSPQLLMDDLGLVSSGLLLMIPGLITDTLAVVFLIGPLRRRLLRAGRRDAEVHTSATPNEERVTLEGDFRRLDD
jgi:UPF0716 protein FxsA